MELLHISLPCITGNINCHILKDEITKMALMKVNEYEIRHCSIQFEFINPSPSTDTRSQHLTLAIPNAMYLYINVSETAQTFSLKADLLNGFVPQPKPILHLLISYHSIKNHYPFSCPNWNPEMILSLFFTLTANLVIESVHSTSRTNLKSTLLTFLHL